MNLRLLKPRTIEERLLFFYGFFGTMPIIELFGLTAFTWMTLTMVIFIITRTKGRIKASRESKYFLMLSAFMLLSCLIGVTSDIPSYWKSLGASNAVWQFFYILIAVYYLNKKNTNRFLFYVQGVYYASIVQCVWGVLQLLVYRISGIAINKMIFYDVLGVELASFVQMRGGSIALTGLCWNAGNLAPLVIIGYLLSQSIYLKLFFMIITAISGSRTLIVGMVACLGIQLFVAIFTRYKGKMKRTQILAIVGAFAIIGFFVFTQRGLLESMLERVQEVRNTFTLGFLQTQASSRVHARYWTTILQVTNWNSFIHNLFGYGIGCSGYPFAVLLNQYADHAWTVECDFINNLWGIGYIGFTLWYIWYAMHIVKSLKVDKRYLMLFAGLLVEGVTYNVTFNWCYVFLIMIFGLIRNQISIFEIPTSTVKLLRGEKMLCSCSKQLV